MAGEEGPALTALPQFIIGGAPRTGTTWLCAMLQRHPAIALAQPIAPEPKFFLVDDLYARGAAYYSQQWFEPLVTASPEKRVLGEKTTNYLECATCAARIHAVLPDVKLIFLLRDPVERAFSNYRWSRKNGFESEPFDRALALDGQRQMTGPLRYARPYDYLRRGCYAELLRPYFALFPPAQILLLRHESLETEPGTIASTVHRFLDVEPRPQDAGSLPIINAADPDAMSVEARRFLTSYYEQPNADLARERGFDISGWAGT